MSVFTWAGFYPAQFNTPHGSAIVAPGQVVEWPDDGPPNEGHGWVETPDAEPTPFDELGPHDESPDESADEPAEETVQAVENMPENIPATPDTPDAPGDETITDTVSPQVTDTATGDTTDQPDSAPAPKRAPRTSNK